MTLLVTGLVLFFATHLLRVVAPQFRERQVARWGRLRWQAGYAAVALAGFLMLVSGYGAVRWSSPLVWGPPPVWTHMLAGLLMAPALVLLVAAYLPGRLRATVRHPMLIATLAWAATHLLANSRVADLLLFGGFLAWSLAVTIASFRRPWTPPGRAPSLLWDGIAVVAGLVAWWWLAFAGGHLRLFGMPVM